MIAHFVPTDGTRRNESIRNDLLSEFKVKKHLCFLSTFQFNILINGACLFEFEQEFFSHTGYWSGLWDHPISENGTPEANEMRCRIFTIDRVLEWVEKYKNIDGRFCFFEVYACFSPLYQQVGKRLLSMKIVGSMDVERTAKPFKHCMLSKDRNRLSDEKGGCYVQQGWAESQASPSCKGIYQRKGVRRSSWRGRCIRGLGQPDRGR
jgi:hypothetical protein